MVEPFPPEGHVLLCPECGEAVVQWEYDADLREVWPMQEMWEGGPTVEATWEMPKMVPARPRWTFRPCGHIVDVAPGAVLTTRPASA